MGATSNTVKRLGGRRVAPALGEGRGQRSVGPLRVAGGDHDTGAGAAQHPDRLHAEAGATAGDDGGPAGQVDPLDDVLGRGGRAEPRVDGLLWCTHGDGLASAWML
ncbi:hypothetical protein GCM10023082_44140 [Streptomyces tremellae]|uniref:Uncharacterized protein n=1 Tax=Streptomyces tremellae TaxID=1124239 RepID=A0ABP7FKY0_9ACTN